MPAAVLAGAVLENFLRIFHGQFDEFDLAQVGAMIRGISHFIEKYPVKS